VSRVPVQPNRDSVTTIRRDGSRFFLHPADVSGAFTLLRRVSAWLLIAVYVALPWIPVNGHPAVFLDVLHRRFHFFGVTLAAQDMWLLFFLITGLGFLLFYLTALFGRIWCGWACPQTVFLEHVYRRIERWLEGDAQARRKLDAAPWDGRKTTLRVLKHGLFILVSVLIAHIFLSYFFSIPAVYGMMRQSPAEHFGAFLFVAAFSGILYFNFAWFREQLCIVICPYGRLQSALIDDDSLVIGYDENRGEPRGKPSEEGVGDCIDCFRCVQVCPTGIDIRQGLQLECIGCAACVDACNDVMARLGRPKGLVRYDSQNGLEGAPRRWLRPRVFLYTALLCLGASVMAFSFSRVEPAIATVTRMQGAPYYVTEEAIRNQFLLRLVNKQNDALTFTVRPGEAPPEGLRIIGMEEGVRLEPMGEEAYTVVLALDREKYEGPFDLPVVVEGDPGGFTLETVFDFLGPDPRLLEEDF
jgi:cytochrome c oxidase accessory protein FixG